MWQVGFSGYREGRAGFIPLPDIPWRPSPFLGVAGDLQRPHLQDRAGGYSWAQTWPAT